MCGIVGYSGSRDVLDVLVKGLRRLEYRGYDSTGVAFFNQDQKLSVIKNEGKLRNVEELVSKHKHSRPSEIFHCGIGHTRWATHGKPTTQNAHPHQTGHVVLVHNGIIENYLEIKSELAAKGIVPKSETDTELYGYLVLEQMDQGKTLLQAVLSTFKRLEGACSVVIMSEKEPGTVIGIRNGSPLVVATDQGASKGAFFASDAQPLLEYTKEVTYLENGDCAVFEKGELKIYDVGNGQIVQRLKTMIDWNPEQLDKGGFDHYMLKEIHEQPAALVDTLNLLLDRKDSNTFQMAKQPGVEILKSAKELILVACGTSWHAALVGKYWIEKFARIPVQVELASEFRYRDPVIQQGTVVIGVSQSGETADTLAVIRELRSKGIKTLGISNVRGCTLSREADAIFYTAAGPEIGVAATKTFIAQLMVLLCFAGALKGEKTSSNQKLFDEMIKLPHLMKSFIEDSDLLIQVKRIAQQVSTLKGFFFMGRGFSFPIALEGALKLKEIAYVHAEGYAAGELKHGPIAMLDEQMCVIVLAPQDLWRDKTVSNLEEVKARGAKVISIGNKGDERLKSISNEMIEIPVIEEPSLLPFLTTLVVQLLSYELALIKGTDVDKPRNLAKSVTVE